MNSIKPSMIALVIVGLGALIANAGWPSHSPTPAPCGVQASDMPPDLCDRQQRCSCESNVLPGNDLYCVKRTDFGYNKAETFSLACIDHWRYCERGALRLCYKGPCAPDVQDNHLKCIMPIDSIGRSP